jgi:phosphoglycerol transferase
MLDQEQVNQNQQRHYLRGSIRFLVYAFAIFLATLTYWVNSNFGRASIEQILYHAQFGLQGLVDTDVGIIKSFAAWCVALPIFTALLLVLIEYSIALFLIHGPKHWFAKPIKVFNLRGIKVFYWFIGHRAPLYTLVICFIYFAIQFSFATFVRSKFGNDYFGAHYIDPKTIKVERRIEPASEHSAEPGTPKNLMLIYVESLENTYKDKALFGRNLLTSLDRLSGISFDSFKQVPGTHWTIAGITATQCGIPLKNVSLYDGNDQGEKVKSFLPNAVCLGDILHQAGYYNVYMGGDALAFSGKGKFFKDHHYDEIYGREELKQVQSGLNMNYWGLYDDDLFVLAAAKLKALHARQQPFNFTITTIDTHGPDGHFSKYCRSRGVKEFRGIVECTADQVANFVNQMKKDGYLKDTNVVILGDHLAMYNPLHKALHSTKERHIYNRFISNAPITKNRENILHFDLYPTILEFIGLNVEGGKLGLGFSGISSSVEQPPATIYEDMNKDLLNSSDRYLELWQEKANK